MTAIDLKDVPVRDFEGGNKAFTEHLNELLMRVNTMSRELSAVRSLVGSNGPTQLVLVKIVDVPTAPGRYPAKLFRNLRGTIPTTGNLTEANLGKLGPTTDCLLVNIAELNGASHPLGVNSYHLAKTDFPMQGSQTVCFVDGCAMTDLRFNESNHAIETSYTCNPGAGDWIPKIIAAACPATAGGATLLTTGGVAGEGGAGEGGLTLNTPNGDVVQITTANTAINGSGAMKAAFTAGTGGSVLTFIEVKATGNTTKGKLNLFRARMNITASTLVRSGTTATFTATNPHGLSNGDYVLVAGSTVLGYNGNYQISNINAAGTSFDYTMSADPGASGAGTIYAGLIRWFDEIAVEEKTVANITETFETIWKPKDSDNGMMVKANDRILISTYLTETFNVTSNGADV